jgi:phage terminase large subunit-like protein
MTITVPRDDLSPLETFALLPDEERVRVERRLSIEERAALLSWRGLRRASQVPPVDDEWLAWFFMAGRGAGKTRAAGEDVIDRVEELASPTERPRWAVISPTYADFRDVAVEGESGLLTIATRRGYAPVWNRSTGEFSTDRWEIQGYSAEKPDRLRGPQHHGAWLDEPGSYRYPKAVWDTLLPSLRLGRSPKITVTGTPKVTWLIRFLVEQAKLNPRRFRLSRASTYRNSANLPSILLEELTRAWGGTRIGRQELMGELLEEAEGALWKLAQLDEDRVSEADVPRDLRVVVGVDPAVTNTAESDETGIVVAGATYERWARGFVLADLSGRWAPLEWARRVIDACALYGTLEVVAEKNNGGDLVASNIMSALKDGDPPIRVSLISAKRSKELRAGPVSTLYEQHRVSHVGTFGELETQQVTWVPGEEETGQDSPDRVDALVYAILELIPEPRVGGSVSVLTGSVRR